MTQKRMEYFFYDKYFFNCKFCCIKIAFQVDLKNNTSPLLFTCAVLLRMRHPSKCTIGVLYHYLCKLIGICCTYYYPTNN